MVAKRKLPSESKDSRHPNKRPRNGASEALPIVEPTSQLNLTSTSSANDSLLPLLDFAVPNTQEKITSRFTEIATRIVQDYRLVISSGKKETEYEIIEFEFYLIKPGCHEDPFTHGSDEQRQSGRWYFHRAGRSNAAKAPPRDRNSTPAGGFRGGSRKGLDLTLGKAAPPVTSQFFPSSNEEQSNLLNDACGGVLLRSLRRISDEKVISGPSLLVDEILRVSKASSVAELVNVLWNGNTTAFLSPEDVASRSPSLFLRRVQKEGTSGTKSPQLYQSPRIGLDLSHASIPVPPNNDLDASKPALSHPRAVFVSKPYRYFVDPHLLTSNGKGQTFLGVYKALMNSDVNAKHIQNELVKRTNLTQSSVEKYLRDYREAKEDGQLKVFIGSSGKGVSAAPSSFLRLMGTLERLTTTV